MSRVGAGVARAAVGTAVLAGVVWLTGPGPFVDGVRALDAVSLVLAVLLTAGSVLACAWRWSLVARGLGVAIGWREAVLACYRSQVLNLTVPGGVVGDVHRGLRHGRTSGETALALRSVAWERTAGQAVQGGALVAVLVLVPGPLGSAATSATVIGLVLVAGTALVLLRARRPSASRVVRAVAADLRHGLGDPTIWPGVVAASLLAVAAHAATFVLAARAVGVTAPAALLVPLALLVLAAAALPTHLAGWGPREGMAVWGFAAVGLGADAGAATATAYGVLVLAAHLPALALFLPGRSGPPAPAIATTDATTRRCGDG